MSSLLLLPHGGAMMMRSRERGVEDGGGPHAEDRRQEDSDH